MFMPTKGNTTIKFRTKYINKKTEKISSSA